MKDGLRSKINVVLTALVAFGVGLGVAAGFHLTPPSFAEGTGGHANVQIGTPPALASELQSATFQDGFAAVARAVSPGVVTVQVEEQAPRSAVRIPNPFRDFFGTPEQQPDTVYQQASGSGFVISPDGYIVTNNHVVEDAQTITVQLADQTTDVALLKIDASDLKPVPLGDSDSTHVGDWVLAIGSPGFAGAGILPTTVTAGIVSAKGRAIGILNQRFQNDGQRGGQAGNPAIEDFIQTDAVINRGNSGGPLVNVRGEVVGMNTAIMSATGYYQGYGFAVPISLVRSVVDDLIKYGKVRRPVLGVLVQPVTPTDAKYYGLDQIAGAKVDDFSGDDSPAEKAGVEAGDIIVSVNGEAIQSVPDLQTKIRKYEPGQKVTIEVVHRASRRHETMTIALGEAAAPGSATSSRTASSTRDNPLGIQVDELSGQIRGQLRIPADVQGVIVTDDNPRGPLDQALRFSAKGMVIQDIDGTTIRSVDDYDKAVKALKAGEIASLKLFSPRSGQQQFVSVEIPQR
jgi:serine protease Do